MDWINNWWSLHSGHYVLLWTLPQLLFLMLSSEATGKGMSLKPASFKTSSEKLLEHPSLRCMGKEGRLICSMSHLSCWDEKGLCFPQDHPHMLQTGHLPENWWFAGWSIQQALMEFFETQRNYVERLFCLLLKGMHLFEGCKLLGFVVSLKY